MNALLALSANIRAQRESGKAEALAGFASRFAAFSAARGKAAQTAQVAPSNNTQQGNGTAAQSAPAGNNAATDDADKKRRRGRKPKGGTK